MPGCGCSLRWLSRHVRDAPAWGGGLDFPRLSAPSCPCHPQHGYEEVADVRPTPGGCQRNSWSSSIFAPATPGPIYRRVREGGRLMPEGLKYVASWIEPNFDRCFQVMECDVPGPLQQWV